MRHAWRLLLISLVSCGGSAFDSASQGSGGGLSGAGGANNDAGNSGGGVVGLGGGGSSGGAESGEASANDSSIAEAGPMGCSVSTFPTFNDGCTNGESCAM